MKFAHSRVLAAAILSVILPALLLSTSCSKSSGKAYDVSEIDNTANVKCTLNVGTEYYLKDNVIKLVQPDGKTFWLTEYAYLELQDDIILVRPTSQAKQDFFQMKGMIQDDANLKCENGIVTQSDVEVPEDLVLIAVDEFNGDVDFVLEQIRNSGSS